MHKLFTQMVDLETAVVMLALSDDSHCMELPKSDVFPPRHVHSFLGSFDQKNTHWPHFMYLQKYICRKRPVNKIVPYKRETTRCDTVVT